MIVRSKHPSSTGFTLVEVLIALSLSVLLAAMLFSSLHTYALGTTAGQHHLAAKQIAESVYQFIGDQLREIVPLTLRSGRERHLLFHGGERRITYVGYIPSHRSAGGLHKNALAIEGHAPHQSLVFSYERLVVDDTFDLAGFADGSADANRTLITDAKAIELEYFGASGETDDPIWSAAWSPTDRLPSLVRIRIERANKRSPDELVVPIYANAISKRTAMTINMAGPFKQNDSRFRARETQLRAEPIAAGEDAE